MMAHLPQPCFWRSDQCNPVAKRFHPGFHVEMGLADVFKWVYLSGAGIDLCGAYQVVIGRGLFVVGPV